MPNNADKSIKFFYKTFFNEYYDLPEKDGKIDFKANIKYTDKNNNQKIVDTQTYEGSIKTLKDRVDENFITINDGENISTSNDFSTQTPVGEYSDTSISSILKWSTKYPSITIHPADIALLKDFYSYPANQFMILRRYDDNVSVPHNLFEIDDKPISTLVGFYDLENEPPIDFGFNEKWAANETDSFWEVLQDLVGIKFAKMGMVGKFLDAKGDNPFVQDLIYKVGQELGFISDDFKNPYGEANLIYETARRAVEGKSFDTGLSIDISLNFETNYEYRQIGDMDGKELLKKQLIKILRMGTSKSVFLAGDKGIEAVSDLFNSFKSGSASALISALTTALTDIAKGAFKTLNNIVFGGADTGSEEEDGKKEENTSVISKPGAAFTSFIGRLDGALGQLIQSRYARYKWKITGVLGTISGMHTTPWNLTLGNPKSPWFSMSNLIIDEMNIKPSGELMFDDFPNSWSVTATLKPGRNMGAQEIYQCFRGASPRKYVSKKELDEIINLTVPEGTTVKIKGGPTINPPTAKTDSEQQLTKNDKENNVDEIDTSTENLKNFGKQ